ncbi:hypothetical protein HANVADRAFT_111019 [Hanseniaspora valbyensis NRRL Y-1626]|uniref:Uncharacterized protein n=1 Tax=Hanseniaspora valbyensis NRRL Y-1626 TaxID=766949 RepID=A0A1B7TGR7_9ASCO|nr:hypothetical protein HANVADRAFT_111019 [Hanseniaspora valbyensis NRRL Y-1626]
MRLKVVHEGANEENEIKTNVNTITYDELFNSSTASSIDVSILVNEYNDKIVDTLIIKDGEKDHTNKLSVIHLTNNGHIIINYINKNNESFNKVYTNIIDNTATFDKNVKVLYHSQKLNCIFVKLEDSIVLFNLINFKRYNKIIEREMDVNNKLHIIENNKYVILSYSVNKLIKLFVWDAATGKYLKLDVIDTKSLKKYIDSEKFMDISFVSSQHIDKLLILFETNIITYDIVAGKLITEKPTLNIKKLKQFHSDIVNFLDNDNINGGSLETLKQSRHNSKQVIKFVAIVHDAYCDIVVIDNYGNLYKYMYSDKNSNTLLMFDKLVLHDTEFNCISRIQQEQTEFKNSLKTLYVYSNDNKLLNICYNNYSIITLKVETYKLDRDFMVQFDKVNNKMNVSKLNYKSILDINNLTINPMNLVNLINKIYYCSDNKMKDQEYLNMIRSSYSKLILLQNKTSKDNETLLTFFNEKAIKYLLPLDVVLALNRGRSNKLFINYLIEIKRYLTNIVKNEATKYNKFFNNKIIINDFNFFIYNEDIDEGEVTIDHLLQIIDEKLFDNYLQKDIKLLELFITSEENKCNVDQRIILKSLIDLLKEKQDDVASILKLIIKYTIFIQKYEDGLEIVYNLNKYLNVEVPAEYINQLLTSYLIEAFPTIVSSNESESLTIFFDYLRRVSNYKSSTTLSSILLQDKNINFNEDLFNDLLAHLESLNKKMVVIFLEYYSINNNCNKVTANLISYYIHDYNNGNIGKLYDLLLNNIGKYDPFEVMIKLNNKDESKDTLATPRSLISCKLLLWKQLKEDGAILDYHYNESKSLGACFEYINSFKETDFDRFKENIQKLHELLSVKENGDQDNYNYWLLFLQEFNNEIEINQIPDFIKITDLQTILLKKLTSSLIIKSKFNKIFSAQEDIISIQEKYKFNKYINQFEEIL